MGFVLVFNYPILIPIALVIFLIKLFLRNRKEKEGEEVVYEAPKNEVKIYTMNPTNLPYEKKASQITEAEKNFYKVLNDAVAGRFDIQRQVSVTSLVNVTSTNHLIHENGTLRNFNPDRSRIDRLSIDFVLFNKDDLSPYLAIELDDRSHEREDRIKRDELVQEILAGTGIRLVRVKNAYSYNPETLDMILNL